MVDPENIFRWRMSPRRLEVESLRDAVLTVSGQLDLRPPTAEQSFLAKRHPHRDAEFFNFSPPFKPHEIEHPYRSVYLPVVRGVLPTMLQLFDFAAPDRPVAQRDESTVPSQALFLMNNAWIIEQSQHTARRLLSAPNLDDAGRIRWLFSLSFARPPTDEELAAATDYLAGAAPPSADPIQQREAQWTSFCQTIFASAEFRTIR